MHIATKTFSKEVGDQVMTLEERAKLEGKLEGKLEIAKTMLAENLPLDFIMKFTSLTLEQIKALASQNGNLGSA